MRPPRSHSNSEKLEKKEEKSAKRSENRNGESSSAVENHLTLDPGKISVIYTRPSLIVNSFPPPPRLLRNLILRFRHIFRSIPSHRIYFKENINSTKFFFSSFSFLFFFCSHRRLKIILAGFKNIILSFDKIHCAHRAHCAHQLCTFCSTTCLIKQPVEKIMNLKFYFHETNSHLIFVLSSKFFFF